MISHCDDILNVFVSMFLPLLYIYVGMEFLGHMVTLCFEDMLNCFPEWLHHFFFLLTIWDLQFVHILTNMCYSIFLVVAILVGMKWYLFVTLISVSLITNDVEHLFMCFLVICIYYLEKCLSKIFAYLKIGLFVFFAVIAL